MRYVYFLKKQLKIFLNLFSNKLANDLKISNQKCGRPLGLRLKKNTPFLYVADAYYGIVKVDLSKGDNYKIILFL